MKYKHKKTGQIFDPNCPEWEVIKEPLFTTADGVDFYEHGKVWLVDKDFDIFDCHSNSAMRHDYSDCPIFSTREAAESWILRNKPLFSVGDILDNPSSVGEVGALLELAQQKIREGV